MKEANDKSKSCAAVLTDLTKAFDYLKYDLLIEKLYAFCFDQKSLRVMPVNPNNRVEVIKVGSYCSAILGLLFFNTNIIDLF